jgi:hypothetical protein
VTSEMVPALAADGDGRPGMARYQY